MDSSSLSTYEAHLTRSFSSLMWLKEGDFLRVSRKLLHERLETLSIDFKALGAVRIE